MKNFEVTLINPNLVVQPGDVFTTGIVYMPVCLAYFAASVRENGFKCGVIDAFGAAPNKFRQAGGFVMRGLTPSETAEKIPSETGAVVVYAINLTSHLSLVKIIKEVRFRFLRIPIIILENTQAVTAYSLRRIQDELYDIGADYCITGESEERGVALLEALRAGAPKEDISRIDGIGFRENGVIRYTLPVREISGLDSLPFPAWDMFPLRNYWKLGYSHGPLETVRYLPLLTSRGCPYRCRFCVIPETTGSRWRARSAKNVADEMEEYAEKFGVKEFHIEDVNPTVSDKRTREICGEIIRRNLKVIWKISSGTKIETIKDEFTIELMAKAGCRYISISPESASPKVLKMMNKSFNLTHALRLVRKMNRVGIYSQACFVLGYPGENREDRKMTRDLVRELTGKGVDEIALFIATPVPGAAMFERFSGYRNYSELTFSPSWREDYKELNRFRLNLYAHFLFWKLLYNPVKLLKQPVNFAIKKFFTKMEMTPYRALYTFFGIFKMKLNRR